jgi:hypothetical protein
MSKSFVFLMLLASCESARVKKTLKTIRSLASPCYITERTDHVNFGMAFVVETASFKCNRFKLFDKNGPWEKKVLAQTFVHSDADGVCTCSLNPSISEGRDFSHTFAIGKFGLKCNAKHCFESYAHQMFAATKYRESPGTRVLAIDRGHWVVSGEEGNFTATQVPTVISTVTEISEALTPTRKADMEQDLVDQGGAVINEVVEEDPVVRTVVVNDIHVNDAVVHTEIEQTTEEDQCGTGQCYHGSCIDQECKCEDGYIGNECEISPESQSISQDVVTIKVDELAEETKDPRVVPAARNLQRVFALSHKEGQCSNLPSPSSGVVCGPIEDAPTCEAARAMLQGEYKKFSHGPSFPKFSDYSQSTSQKLRSSVPGFCSAKIIGGDAWHVKFNGVDKEERSAPFTRRDAHIHFRVLCGCFNDPDAPEFEETDEDAQKVVTKPDDKVIAEPVKQKGDEDKVVTDPVKVVTESDAAPAGKILGPEFVETDNEFFKKYRMMKKLRQPPGAVEGRIKMDMKDLEKLGFTKTDMDCFLKLLFEEVDKCICGPAERAEKESKEARGLAVAKDVREKLASLLDGDNGLLPGVLPSLDWATAVFEAKLPTKADKEANRRESVANDEQVAANPAPLVQAPKFVKAVPLERNEGLCSDLSLSGMRCGRIEDASTCSKARENLIQENAAPSFGPFADYSTSSSRKLRSSVPGFCSIKLISGGRGDWGWHVKFNGVDKEESLAPASRKNSATQFRLLCGCWEA